MPVCDPELAWGAFQRVLGGILCLHFASSALQLRALVGRDGLEPVHLLLRAVRRDLGVLRGLLRFPTLFWVADGDGAVTLVPLLGLGCSAGLVFGGEGSPVLWAGAWICALSIHTSNSNLYSFPWDNLLLECAFLGMFLPPLRELPDLGAVQAPRLVPALAFHWLLFRVMFGMGLAKFRQWDARTRDLTYVHAWLEWQPFPTAAAHWARSLPMALHKVALVALFLVEMGGPFLVFGPPGARALAAALFAGLQLGIWVCGNYGTFNVLTLALCLPLLGPAPWRGPVQLAPADGLLVALMVGSLPYLLFFNSWTGARWLYRLRELPAGAWARPALGVLRALSPFRLLHSYGVFVPTEGATRRYVLVLQGSLDAQRWLDYEPRYLSTREDRRPPFFAPHHPRLDHFLAYAIPLPRAVKLCTLFGDNPYYVHPHGLVEKIVQKLLRGDPTASAAFGRDPFQGTRPRYLRLSLWHFQFTGPQERAAGRWWNRRLLFVSHLVQSEDLPEDAGLRSRYEPFVFDAVVDDPGLGHAVRDPQTGETVPLHRYPVRRLTPWDGV